MEKIEEKFLQVNDELDLVEEAFYYQGKMNSRLLYHHLLLIFYLKMYGIKYLTGK